MQHRCRDAAERDSCRAAVTVAPERHERGLLGLQFVQESADRRALAQDDLAVVERLDLGCALSSAAWASRVSASSSSTPPSIDAGLTTAHKVSFVAAGISGATSRAAYQLAEVRSTAHTTRSHTVAWELR